REEDRKPASCSAVLRERHQPVWQALRIARLAASHHWAQAWPPPALWSPMALLEAALAHRLTLAQQHWIAAPQRGIVLHSNRGRARQQLRRARYRAILTCSFAFRFETHARDYNDGFIAFGFPPQEICTETAKGTRLFISRVIVLHSLSASTGPDRP